MAHRKTSEDQNCQVSSHVSFFITSQKRDQHDLLYQVRPSHLDDLPLLLLHRQRHVLGSKRHHQPHVLGGARHDQVHAFGSVTHPQLHLATWWC